MTVTRFQDQLTNTEGPACDAYTGNEYRPHVEAHYDFTVQCTNGLNYYGSLVQKGHQGLTQCYDAGNSPPNSPLADQTYDPAAQYIGRWRVPNPFSEIVAHWTALPVQLPALDPTQAGRLSRPILVVPGWGSSPDDWGVNLIPREETSLGLVHATGYRSGSLPYVMAKMEGLNVNFNASHPDQGINSNGLYFFQAYATWYQNAVHWDNSAWSYLSTQPNALYASLGQVMDKHFGAGWRTDPSKQIDIVCHSQGCLVVREMLAHVSGATGPQEACNHIRKVLSVDSPHFGSPLGDDPVPSDHADDLAPFINGLTDNGQTIFSGKLDKDFMDYMKLMNRGGSMGVDQATGFMTRHPDATAAAGLLSFGTIPWLGIAGSWLIGDLMGGDAEVYLDVKGGYMSPYHITTTVQPQLFGFDVVDATVVTVNDTPTTEGQKLLAVHDNASHLGTRSPWILDLGNHGYPRRPDGMPVQFQALWSSNVRGIMGEVLGSLGGIVPNSCPQSETDPAVSCFAFEDYLWSQVGAMVNDQSNLGGNFTNRYFDPTFTQTLQKVHDKWLFTSDILVDSSSQKFLTRQYLRPDENAVFSDPRTYTIHQALMPNYPYNQVPHGPIPIDLTSGQAGIQLPLKLDHPGASQEGMDLYCALDLSCDQMLTSSHLPPLFPTGAARAVALTAPSLTWAGTEAVTGMARSIDLSGDLQVALLSQDAGLQALSIPATTGASPAAVVGWTPDRGAWVWQAQGNQVQYLGTPGQRGRLQVTRTGNAWSAGFAPFSGAAAAVPLVLTSDGTIALDVVESSPSASTFLVGTATPLSSAAYHPVDSGSFVLLHSETAGDAHNVSRPRISLYNGTQRTVSGLKLCYYFTADPSRIIVALVSSPQPFPVSVQYLGSGVNVATIDLAGLELPPGTLLCSPGLELELRYNDWSNWLVFRDWSNNHNYGLPKLNDRIQVLDGAGNVLWGQAQPVPSVDAPVVAWGAAVASEPRGGGNQIRPHLVLENPGQATVVGPHLRYFFRIPSGSVPVASADYLPHGRLSLAPYAGNVWALDWSDSSGLLLPGARQDIGDVGIHLDNSAPLPESDTILSYQSGPLAANHRILLLDRMGDTIWGRAPALRQDTSVAPADSNLTPGDVQVEAWDEGAQEANHPKPRLVLSNVGSLVIQHLVVRYFFAGDASKTAQLESSDWYLPKCSASLVPGAPQWEVRLDCRDLALAPGDSYPDPSGMIFGLHWPDWSNWNRAADWSGQILNANRKADSHIVVEDGAGHRIWGQIP